MYCIKCGVQLDNHVKQCPLCQTKLQYPESAPEPEKAYPEDHKPQVLTRPGAIKATLFVLFLIPLLVTFLVDYQIDGVINWFGYAAGGILLGFIVLVFPFWFRNQNPAFFVGCDFLAAVLYLHYIALVTEGSWFLSFAVPVTFGCGVPLIALMLLLQRFPKQKLYICGGGLIALGLYVWMLEWLLDVSFHVAFYGWSYSVLGSFVIIGGLLIYLAANDQARQKLERKIFM